MDEKEKTKSEDKKPRFNISELAKAKYIEYKAEFKKIIWPNRNNLIKQSTTVVVVSLIFGAIIFVMDSIYSLGIQLFVGIIG